MKRWMIYLLVLVGIHVYFVSVLNKVYEPYRERMKKVANPIYSVPNWSDPLQDDIFMVKDKSGVIRYYKILESVVENNITLLEGKYRFVTELEESMKPKKWTFEFMNDPKLYSDSIQQFSLKEFKDLKEDAYFTRGFRLQKKKGSILTFLKLYNHYQSTIKSFIWFFIIWFFTFLNTYFFSFSREKLLIMFGSFLFCLLWYGAPIYEKDFRMGIYIYGKMLFMAFSIFYLIDFLNKKGVRRCTFSDREAAKFTAIVVVGFLLSCAFSYFQFFVYKLFGINLFGFKIDKLLTDWRLDISSFYIISWLSFATGNFLNNFRIHFFQLRRKANAFKYARAQELEFKSELDTLQAKINPHFLYNSLNSIASLAQFDPQKTEKMALALSKFYKEKTNRKERIWSTVSEELAMLQTYLSIEKIRFGDRLEVMVDDEETVEDEKMPRFLLQPLIENAIKYGYRSEDNKIIVKIKIERQKGNLIFRIYDSGLSFSDKMDTGYGIRSVQKKLKLFYPNRHKMIFINHPEKQVFIQIKL